MRYSLFLVLVCLTACKAAPTFDAAVEEAAIIATLTAQDDAWNTGDIEAFMADYVKDDTLRFASGGTVESGWQSTLDRYLRRYPDRAAMGTLSFTDLDVEVFDADDALVFGRWRLERESDMPGGLFTLHMVKRDGPNGKEWLIQSDHTSSAD